MNRNTLTIGGICIVTILILVSFNCVVGHQSASNNIAKTSPLFNIRINRVLNNKQDSLDCVYNGMNENLSHFFPQNKEHDVYRKIEQLLIQLRDKNYLKLKKIVRLFNDINTKRNAHYEQLDEILNPCNSNTSLLSDTWTWKNQCSPTSNILDLECFLIWILVMIIFIPIEILVNIIKFIIWKRFFDSG